jgi:Asp-tRNA(Asn)/Glu-tRNA(Gln) amidotransferase A subunit family amidase
VQTGAIAIEEATIANLQAAYMAGRTTVRAVTQAHLDRIAVYDKRGPLINSLITVNSHALDEADRLDAALRTTGEAVGPLHGIPVVVKDNIDVAGLPMTAGFQGWKNYYPPEDAPLIKRIRAAGGIILAKASLSEFRAIALRTRMADFRASNEHRSRTLRRSAGKKALRWACGKSWDCAVRWSTIPIF